VQLARLLALTAADGVGKRQRPGVRYRSTQSLGYPMAAVESAEVGEDGAWQIDVNLLGTLGPSGTMPWHYTEHVVAVDREMPDGERSSVRAFFDVFDHHFTGLLAAVLSRRHLPIAVERADRRGLVRVLDSVAGVAAPATRQAFAGARTFGLAEIERYAGLLGRTPRSTLAVEQILEAVLGVRTRVTPFEGHWMYLDESRRTRLGSPRRRGAACLRDAPVLGGRVWALQGAIAVRIGPLDRATFSRFLPTRRGRSLGSAKMTRELIRFLRFSLGANFDFKIVLVVARDAISGTRLASGRLETWNQRDDGDGLPPLLGLTSWIGRNMASDRDDPVLRVEGWQPVGSGADDG
jgi:type VI secretion system ImpH/TssG family protein